MLFCFALAPCLRTTSNSRSIRLPAGTACQELHRLISRAASARAHCGTRHGRGTCGAFRRRSACRCSCESAACRSRDRPSRRRSIFLARNPVARPLLELVGAVHLQPELSRKRELDQLEDHFRIDAEIQFDLVADRDVLDRLLRRYESPSRPLSRNTRTTPSGSGVVPSFDSSSFVSRYIRTSCSPYSCGR